MQRKDIDKSENHEPREYLSDAQRAYGFEFVNGIHRPKSAEPQSAREHRTPDQIYNRPLVVRVLPDWPLRLISVIGLGVSALTLVLLALTVCYAKKQWNTMNQTFDEIRKQTGYAATNSATSTAGLQNTQNFFRIDERAWVDLESVQPVDLNIPPGVPQPPSQLVFLRVSFRNFGKTSAINISVKSMTRSFELKDLTRDRIEKDFLDPARLQTYPVTPILAPGNDTFIGKGGGLVGRPYTGVLGERIYSGHFGRITYDDIFGEHHWRTFCYYLSDGGGFSACPYGNAEDKDKNK